LDAFAGAGALGKDVSTYFRQWATLKDELTQLRRDQSERFQLMDTLRFQIDELEHAQLAPEEDNRLEEERRRLQNAEKLTQLATETYQLIYEDEQAAISRLQQTVKRLAELSEFDSRFDEYQEGLDAARAVLEDLAFSVRDFLERLEFSPQRLAEIEDRLAELSRIKRKYGGSIETALEHLARSQDRLDQVERSDERENELQELQNAACAQYLAAARRLHEERMIAAKKFEQAVEHELSEVAMEAARFRVNIQADLDPSDTALTARGIDRVEFNFSANVGEEVKPLARVASGGEASRLMLVLKTVANAAEFPRTIVFDEIDSGIGGRVSEAVGSKLKKLSVTNQVLCVTHQPQIARFADTHLRVQKEASQGRTEVLIERLDRRAQVEELARMLTGAEITDSARRHARELLKTR
jgi:DNA repair protein RecN (Recombination protein N)